MFDFIKNIGPAELIVVAIILIVFFGGKAIAGLAKTSGQTVKEIKNVKREFTKAIEIDDKKSRKN